MKEVLIAGLGNPVLSDDGLGLHVVRALRFRRPEGCLIAEIGTAIFSVMHLFQSARRIIIVDAVKGGKAPGTVHEPREFKLQEVSAMASVHEHEVAKMLSFLPINRRPKVWILGVEVESLDYGIKLTPTVLKAVPKAVDAVLAAFTELERVKSAAEQKIVVAPVVPALAVGARQAQA